MVSDRLKTAIRKIVEDYLAERDAVDYRGFYAAKVVSQTGDELDLRFEDDRIRSKSSAPLCPATPGQVLVLTAGTRVLVGWIDGDPSEPYVVGVWLGDGGLKSLDETFTERRRFLGPMTEVKSSSSATATEVALKNDTVNCGTIVFATVAMGVLTGTYTAPSGATTPITIGATIPLSGKITGPCASNLKAT